MIHLRRRHGFTLVEAVAAIVVLSIALPTTMIYLNDSAHTRADSVTTARVGWLTQAILQTCQADAASAAPALGFDNMNRGAGYQQSLANRIRPAFADFYKAFGLSWRVKIDPVVVNRVGADVDATLAPGKLNPDYLQVAATVDWTNAQGQSKSLTTRTVVARP